MEGCALLGSLCPDRCSCFNENSTDFSMPLLCSEKEGCELPDSLCLDHCSCFYEHTTDFSIPLLCCEKEGRELVAIPDIHIRSGRH
jgi:hypothetical protein